MSLTRGARSLVSMVASVARGRGRDKRGPRALAFSAGGPTAGGG